MDIPNIYVYQQVNMVSELCAGKSTLELQYDVHMHNNNKGTTTGYARKQEKGA